MKCFPTGSGIFPPILLHQKCNCIGGQKVDYISTFLASRLMFNHKDEKDYFPSIIVNYVAEMKETVFLYERTAKQSPSLSFERLQNNSSAKRTHFASGSGPWVPELSRKLNPTSLQSVCPKIQQPHYKEHTYWIQLSYHETNLQESYHITAFQVRIWRLNVYLELHPMENGHFTGPDMARSLVADKWAIWLLLSEITLKYIFSFGQYVVSY